MFIHAKKLKYNRGLLITFLSEQYLLLILLTTSIAFRFYNAFSRYSLGYESIRDANIAVVGAHTLQLPLTGPFSSLGPFTFGPWYWYHLILFQLLFPFYYSPWILLGISSLVFVVVLFKIGELLGDKKLGFTIALLGAISRYMISWSTMLTNPGFTFVYAALSIWLFLRIIKQKSSLWWSFSLGICIGIGINIHYQMLPFVLFLVLLLVFKFKKPLFFVTACVGTFMTFIPLLIFEIRNNFYMFKTIADAYIHMNERIYVPNSWKLYLLDFWPNAVSETLGVPVVISFVIIAGIVTSFGYLILKKEVSKELLLLGLAFFVFFVYLRFYGGERSMGYIHFLIPFIFIFSGFAIWRLYAIKYGSYLYYGVVVTLLIWVLPNSFNQIIFTDPASVKLRSLSHAIVNEYPDKNITLYHCEDEGQSDIATILYMLHFENKLGNDGVNLALNSSCIQNIEKKLNVQVKKVKLSNNETVVNLDQLTEARLAEAQLKAYTMESLYASSAFWWKGKKL